VCGIVGRLNFRSGAPVDPHLIHQMCDLLAHRGPDGAGVDVRGPIGLGHRRLAIIDLSPAGRQPMTDGLGLTITFNGEIYNFLELRAELERQGHRFRTKTDTEVLLAAYRQYGVDCVGRLRGMFAFAIWDADKRRLFAARDRVGKKPLHYFVDRDGICFASEPKAFLADPAFHPEPDLQAISHYLSLQYVPSPFSAFKGVAKLPPAHYLIVENGNVSIRRYWKLEHGAPAKLTEEDASNELLARLKESVKLRLVSDVPLGAFLSGGIDSSAVVALMAEHGGAPVKTFSIGFDEKEYDELPYARAVAKRYGTEHHEFIVRPNAADVFDKLVWHYNEPYADESAIPTYYLSELTRRHVTVALNGDGGDENFAGYTRYSTLASDGARRLSQPLRRLRPALDTMERWVPTASRSDRVLWRGKRWLQRAGATPARRYAWRMMQFDPFLKGLICTPAFLQQAGGDNSGALLESAYRRSTAATDVDAMLDTDVAYYLPDCLLVKVDVATMAHGLEGRSPLLDHAFMEFAASLPSHFRLRGATGKYIFRKAVQHLLPEQVLRRRKMGFGVPLDHWFRHELRELAYDTLLGRRLAERGYFRMPMVKRLLDEHVRGIAQWHDHLWNLLMLERWQQMFVDRRPVVTPSPESGALAPAFQ
jgi:asparagine synthase (glutamine-hydrolysing)